MFYCLLKMEACSLLSAMLYVILKKKESIIVFLHNAGNLTVILGVLWNILTSLEI